MLILPKKILKKGQTLENSPNFFVKFATSDSEYLAAQRLRYKVFISELGGRGDLVDHENKLERDRFDPYFEHLILIDRAQQSNYDCGVVGVYRLMTDEKAKALGRFYSEDEYDLTKLKQSGRKLLELGRSCVHPDYRGGTAVFHLWKGLSEFVQRQEIEILFGVASFQGTDLNAIAAPLSLLHQHHLAPPELRVTVKAQKAQKMDIIPPESLDRRKAVLEIPALIKAYLRLGGFVGHGAFVDYDFNTTDVCLILDTKRMHGRQKEIYSKYEISK